LALSEVQFRRELTLVAVVKPRCQALRGREQVDVRRDEPGVDEIVGLLRLRVLEPWFLESGVRNLSISRT